MRRGGERNTGSCLGCRRCQVEPCHAGAGAVVPWAAGCRPAGGGRRRRRPAGAVVPRRRRRLAIGPVADGLYALEGYTTRHPVLPPAAIRPPWLTGCMPCEGYTTRHPALPPARDSPRG